MPFLGEIRLYAGAVPPPGWARCDGSSSLPVQGNEALLESIGTNYGFGAGVVLPDLRSRVPVHLGPGVIAQSTLARVYGGVETVSLAPGQVPAHNHQAGANSNVQSSSAPNGALPAAGTAMYFIPPSLPSLPNSSMASTAVGGAGGGQSHPNIQPYCCVNFIICTSGGVPMTNGATSGGAFVAWGGMLMLSACGDLVPNGFERTDGQPLSQAAYSGLFALLGTVFGSAGTGLFNLPDLIGRTINGVGAGISIYNFGDLNGEASHILTVSEMASHNHTLYGTTTAGSQRGPTAGYFAFSPAYTGGVDGTTLASAQISFTGAPSPHENRQPFTGLTCLIAADDVNPDGYTGEIRIAAVATAPSGWQACDGSSLNTTTNSALFAVIGYTFGGSGSSFSAPNFAGCVPVGAGTGNGLSAYGVGQVGGVETVALNVAQTGAHAHLYQTVDGFLLSSILTIPAGHIIGPSTGSTPFADSGFQVPMNNDAIRSTGGGIPHENRMPMAAFYFYIKL